MSNVVSIKDGKPVVPDFITRVDINKMSDEQLDELLEAIRGRRMNNYIIYKQTEEEKETIRIEKARVLVDKKAEQIVKSLASLDKTFEKLEKQVAELRGLRIQANMSVL